MKPRERVLKALAHQEPDRVPLDCGGTVVTGVDAAAYNRLKGHLGIKGGQTQVYHTVMQVALVEPWFLDRFEVDVVDLGSVFCDNPKEWVDFRLADGALAKMPAWMRIEKRHDGRVFVDHDGDAQGIMPHGGFYFDQLHWPLMEPQPDEVSNLPHYLDKIVWNAMSVPQWGSGAEPGFYATAARKAKKLYEESDRAIVTNFNGAMFEALQRLFRHDNFFANLASDRKRVEAILDRMLELHIASAEKFLKAVGPYVHVVRVADDLGMQTGPQISPRMFREVFVPRYKELFSAVKRFSGAKLFMHCCGSIYRLLPDLIDAGVDITNPVQTSAAEMEPKRLKAEFGKDIVFWGGGCDNQTVLSHGTVEDVRREVTEKMEILAPGGGFVFSQVHNIVPETPPENVLAMFDEFKRHRDYSARGP